MRKCLGVLAVVGALSVVLWAQAPTPTPSESGQSQPSAQPPSSQSPAPAPSAPVPQEPTSTSVPIANRHPVPKFARVEFFGGYSFAQAGLFNAGHWAQLNGWDTSFAVNAVDWLGLVVEGGEHFGTSQIPTNVPAPFPSCPPFCPGTFPTFNADTREYNVLFGAQFPYRKYERWVPFGEVFWGHDGVRGEAIAQGLDEVEVGTGRALVAGGGADHKINERFAIRFKADYFETQTSFPSFGKKKQDNLKLSVGIVIRSVRKKKRHLEEETEAQP